MRERFTSTAPGDMLEAMSTVVEIQQAIVQLPERDKRQLARWFEEQLEEIWDAEIEEDVKAGRLDHLVA